MVIPQQAVEQLSSRTGNRQPPSLVGNRATGDAHTGRQISGVCWAANPAIQELSSNQAKQSRLIGPLNLHYVFLACSSLWSPGMASYVTTNQTKIGSPTDSKPSLVHAYNLR